MKLRITVFGLFLFALTMSTFTPYAYALALPSFPSCSNPSGSIKASYPSGIHGIAGRSENYSGADTVYQVSSNTLIQCFCPTNNNGIQTNWMKADTFSSDEIQILKNQGWLYIPNGSLWGLTKDPYFAKNGDYNCGGDSSTSNNNSGGSSNTNSDSGVKSVLGLTTIPSGFAPTGSILSIFLFVSLGLSIIAFGIYLRKKSS